MSAAIKSRSKSSAKAFKEQRHKVSPKLTAPVSGGNNITGGAYNPMSGTFHNLERASPAPSSVPPQSNIHEREEHPGSPNPNCNSEYDSTSNGSSSGESEDLKEKNSASSKLQQEAIPGSDMDKREKVRQRNEKKHQRQREKRALELHERCTGYLMSRKLEVLAQQLVAMGFLSERATTALILNEGRVEESIAWLLEQGEGEQADVAGTHAESSIKIDIGYELAKMVDMEVEFKCSKQEVERAIVTCEGDVEKAAELLKGQRQEAPVLPTTPGATSEPPPPPATVTITAASREHKVVMPLPNRSKTARSQQMTTATFVPQQQQRGEDREFKGSKVVPAGATPHSSKVRNLQAFRPHPKVESSRLQVLPTAEKRLPVGISTTTVPISCSASSVPSPVGLAPSKADVHNAMVGSDAKTDLRTAAPREPVVVMQRSQSSAKTNLHGAVGLVTSPVVTSGWNPSALSNIEASKAAAGGLGAGQLQSVRLIPSGVASDRVQYSMSQHQPLLCRSADGTPVGLGGSVWNPTAASTPAPLAVPAPLGLFTGWGSSSGSPVSPSPVDWSRGNSMMQCDYASIDWRLDTATPKTTADQGWLHNAWAVTISSAKQGRQGVNGGACVADLQDGGAPVDMFPSVGGLNMWTSPFAGKDIFSLSRRYVTSPSL